MRLFQHRDGQWAAMLSPTYRSVMEDAFYVRLRDDTVQRWEFGAIVASCKYAGEWPPPDNVSR